MLDELAYQYKNIDPATGIMYANEEMEMAVRLGKPRTEAYAWRALGLNYEAMSDYPKAADCYYKALAIFEDIPGPVTAKLASEVMANIAVVYNEQGNYAKALEYDLKSLAFDQKAGIKSSVAGDYGNIANVYMSLADFPKALEYDFMSLKIFEELGDKNGIASNLGNIGNVYQAQGKYEEALENNFKALEVFRQIGEKEGVANCLGNIGVTYVQATTGKMPTAGKYIMAGSDANLSRGIEYLQQGIAASKEIGQLDNIIEFSKDLAQADSLSGNYREALINYKQYTKLKDSVYSAASKVQIAGLETRRALELKNKQIQIDKLEVAQRRNERILLIIGLVFLALIIVVILRKFYIQVSMSEQLAKEKKEHLAHIKAQADVLADIAYIQSHEVRAPIASIRGLVQLFNFKDYTDPVNKQVIANVSEATESLDVVIKEVIRIENTLINNTLKVEPLV